MIARNGIIGYLNIAAAAAPNGIFPVQNGEMRAGGGILQHDDRVFAALSLFKRGIAAPDNVQNHQDGDGTHEHKGGGKQPGAEYARDELL